MAGSQPGERSWVAPRGHEARSGAHEGRFRVTRGRAGAGAGAGAEHGDGGGGEGGGAARSAEDPAPLRMKRAVWRSQSAPPPFCRGEARTGPGLPIRSTREARRGARCRSRDSLEASPGSPPQVCIVSDYVKAEGPRRGWPRARSEKPASRKRDARGVTAGAGTTLAPSGPCPCPKGRPPPPPLGWADRSE